MPFTGDLISLKSEVPGKGGALWVLWELRLHFLLSCLLLLLLALPVLLRISQVFNKRGLIKSMEGSRDFHANQLWRHPIYYHLLDKTSHPQVHKSLPAFMASFSSARPPLHREAGEKDSDRKCFPALCHGNPAMAWKQVAIRASLSQSLFCSGGRGS